VWPISALIIWTQLDRNDSDRQNESTTSMWSNNNKWLVVISRKRKRERKIELLFPHNLLVYVDVYKCEYSHYAKLLWQSRDQIKLQKKCQVCLMKFWCNN